MQWQRPLSWPSQPQGHSRVAFLPFVPLRIKCKKPKKYVDDPQSIGEHIRKRRIELGLSQPDLAKLLGVSSATVLNWERGKTPPLITHMGKVIEFLGYYPFPEPVTISERLLRKRRENGWTIEEAATQIGVDPATWRDWEDGKTVLYRRHRQALDALLTTPSRPK